MMFAVPALILMLAASGHAHAQSATDNTLATEQARISQELQALPARLDTLKAQLATMNGPLVEARSAWEKARQDYDATPTTSNRELADNAEFKYFLVERKATKVQEEITGLEQQQQALAGQLAQLKQQQSVARAVPAAAPAPAPKPVQSKPATPVAQSAPKPAPKPAVAAAPAAKPTAVAVPQPAPAKPAAPAPAAQPAPSEPVAAKPQDPAREYARAQAERLQKALANQQGAASGEEKKVYFSINGSNGDEDAFPLKLLEVAPGVFSGEFTVVLDGAYTIRADKRLYSFTVPAPDRGARYVVLVDGRDPKAHHTAIFNKALAN